MSDTWHARSNSRHAHIDDLKDGSLSRETTYHEPSSLSHRSTLRSTFSGLRLSSRSERSSANKNVESSTVSAGYRGDQLGLFVVHEPERPPIMDIVFVHGLGGTARKTWCKDRDLSMFWPKEWLAKEKGMEHVRIFSYGYNAHFSSTANKDSILNISDFAKDLLYALKFAVVQDKRSKAIGDVPLVFVAHSMGGLVVKKAFILGLHDEHYEHIIHSIRGIVFLACPHGGSHLSGTLNKLLSASLAGHTPKQYIAELSAHSPTLQAINEQWRTLAPKLTIVSMFETLPTSIGPLKAQILNEETSTLGFPGEITKSLNADHHGVCKYDNRMDPNYISVRDLLKHMVGQVQANAPDISRATSVDDFEISASLERFLGPMETLSDDLDFFSEKQLGETCQWFLEDSRCTSFLDDTEHSGVLWCTGPPGFGKSVLCSSVINHLRDRDELAAFYFFRFGDQAKNNISTTLATIAYQAAVAIPSYRKICLRLSEQGVSVRRLTTRSLWQKLFADSLLKSHEPRTLHLVIDGLDECEDAGLLLKYLQELKSSRLVVKLICFSRKTHSLLAAFDKLAKIVHTSVFDLSESDYDLRNFIDEEMDDMHGTDDFKDRVREILLEKSQGNFLWTSLVINEIRERNTEAEVDEALTMIPVGLEDLYQRMDVSLERRLRSTDKAIARTIFQWIACARRALHVDELQEALVPDHGRIVDLPHTISKVCGDFLVVDGKKAISVIHLTAKDYLLQESSSTFYVNEVQTHHRLMMKALEGIRAYDAQMAKSAAKPTPFLHYAATSWPFHLQRSNDFDDQNSLAALTRFFDSRCVLTWIYLLASVRELRVLVQASKALTALLRLVDRLDADRNPMMHRLQDKETINAWSTDLIRLVGKFWPQLISSPKLIFKLIPAFCPPDSAIRRQFDRSASAVSIEIRGLEQTAWDDCVAKFAAPNNQSPLGIRCTNRYLALLLRTGVVALYYSDTLEEARQVKHGERVSAWAFNQLGDKLVTSSLSHTTVWSPSTGRELFSISHHTRTRPLAITFAADDQQLVICTDDRRIQRAILNVDEESTPHDDSHSLTGQTLHSLQENEPSEENMTWTVVEGALGPDVFEGRQLPSPYCVEFNLIGTLVAVTYREMELMVWSIEEPSSTPVGRCRRVGHFEDLHNISASDVQRICWNNATGHVLGMIRDKSCVFKWHPYTNEYVESVRIPLGTLACSTDGKFFVTGSKDGSLRVWDFHHFSVIYQLSCNILVTDLAIDPESARIFDIRETFCSVWNPNALIRMWEIEDRVSDDARSTPDSSTQSSTFSEYSHHVAAPITSLAVSHENLAFAAGDQEGNVTHFSPEGQRLHILGKGFMTIGPLCWSDDGSYLAYSDLARQIQVERLSLLESSRPARNALKAKEYERTIWLLFDPSHEHLLASSERFVQIWSIKQKKRLSTWPQVDPVAWINDPKRPGQVIGFGFSTIRLTSWEAFSDTKVLRLVADENVVRSHMEHVRRPTLAYPMSPSETRASVDKVLISIDGSEALMQTSETTSQGQRHHWQTVYLSGLAEQDHATAHPLPADLQACLLMPLGFVMPEALEKGPRRNSAAILYAERRRSSASSQAASTAATGAMAAISTRTKSISEDVVSRQEPIRRPSAPVTSAAEDSYHVLAFLDRNFWVCTYTLRRLGASPEHRDPDAIGRVKRHYFLPRDWLNAGGLEMTTMRPDGALLCPKNGEVAVVMNGLREEWTD